MNALRGIAPLMLFLSLLSQPVWADTDHGQSSPEQEVLQYAPTYFFESGYFSADSSYAQSPYWNFIAEELLPLVKLATTSFMFGYTHKLFTGQSVLYTPVITLFFHIYMLSGSSSNILFSLMPTISDLAFTKLAGERWAGSMTSAFRFVVRFLFWTRVLGPELMRSSKSFIPCPSRDLILETEDDLAQHHAPASLSLFRCVPDDMTGTPAGPGLHISFYSEPDATRYSNPLYQVLAELAQSADSLEITDLLLVPVEGSGLRVMPGTDCQWLLGWTLDETPLQQRQAWWTEQDFRETVDGQIFKSPLSIAVLTRLQQAIQRPGNWQQLLSSHEPPDILPAVTAMAEHEISREVQQVAGVAIIPVTPGLSLWIQQPEQSLIPGSYRPLPSVVLYSGDITEKQMGELGQHQVIHLLGETMRLPWRIYHLWLSSYVCYKAAAAGEQLAIWVNQIMQPLIFVYRHLPGLEAFIVFRSVFDPPVPPIYDQYSSPFQVDVGDGKHLEGVLVRVPHPIPDNERNLLIFFHPNRLTANSFSRQIMESEIQGHQTVRDLMMMYGFDVLFPEYRGYGNELPPVDAQTFLDDADRFYKQVQNNYHNIVVAGHSLGTGAAIWVGAENKPAGVMLISSFYTAADFSPVSFLINRLNIRNDLNIRRVTAPLYLFHGMRDTTFSCMKSVQLHQNAKEARGKQGELVHVTFFENRGHDNTCDSPFLWSCMLDFLKPAASNNPYD